MYEKIENLIQETPYQIVYSLAKTLNEHDLQTWVAKTGNSVSIWQGIDTPIMTLAEEGNFKAVAFLMDKFDGNILYALEGYARGGWHKQVQLLLETSNPSYAARGYAYGGFKEELHALMENNTIDLNMVSEGLARQGKIQEIINLINPKNKRAIKMAAFTGFVYSRNKEAIQDFDWEGIQPETRTQLELMASARLGDEKKYTKILKKNSKLAPVALRELARGGHLKQVQELLKTTDDIKTRYQAVFGFILSGNIHVAYSYISSYKRVEYIGLHARAGQYKHVNALFKDVSLSSMGKRIPQVCLNYFKAGFLNPNHLLRLLYLSESKPLQYQLIEAASRGYPELIKANVIQLMNQYADFKKEGLTYHEVLEYLQKHNELRKGKCVSEISNAQYWLLSDQYKAIKKAELPTEIISHINTYVLGASSAETESYITLANERMERHELKEHSSYLCKTKRGVMISPYLSMRFGYLFNRNPLSHHEMGAIRFFDLKAYHEALKLDLQFGLSLEWLKTLQKAVGLNVAKFRNQETALYLHSPVKHQRVGEKSVTKYYSNPNMTWLGVKELLADLFQVKRPIHYLELIASESGKRSYKIYPLDIPGKETARVIQILSYREGAISDLEFYKAPDDIWLENILVDDSYTHKLHIIPIDQPGFLSLDSQEKIQSFIMEETKKLCESYNKKIPSAAQNEKLYIIVGHVKWLYQLAIFSETKASFFYLLLNRLLHEEKMPFSLFDCERLLAFSTPELVEIVKDGQMRYLRLLQGLPVSFTDSYTILEPQIVPNKIRLDKTESELFTQVLQNNFDRLPKEYTETLYYRKPTKRPNPLRFYNSLPQHLKINSEQQKQTQDKEDPGSDLQVNRLTYQ